MGAAERKNKMSFQGQIQEIVKDMIWKRKEEEKKITAVIVDKGAKKEGKKSKVENRGEEHPLKSSIKSSCFASKKKKKYTASTSFCVSYAIIANEKKEEESE